MPGRLIYARLEREYSPTVRAGYQVAHHAGLTRDDVAHIETHVRRWDTSRGRQTVRFAMPDGRRTCICRYSAVGKGAHLYAEIMDRSQRGVAFIADCCVIVSATARLPRAVTTPTALRRKLGRAR